MSGFIYYNLVAFTPKNFALNTQRRPLKFTTRAIFSIGFVSKVRVYLIKLRDIPPVHGVETSSIFSLIRSGLNPAQSHLKLQQYLTVGDGFRLLVAL